MMPCYRDMAIKTLDDCTETYKRWKRREGDNPPFPWGVPFLDRELGDACPGHLYCVGAGTNVGKSLFSLLLVAECPRPAAYVSLEDSPAEVGRRVRDLAPEARVKSFATFPVGKLSQVLLAIREVAEAGARLVVIDYLQLLGVDGDVPVWGRNDEIREAVKALKHLSRELNIVPVLVSQLNRTGAKEKRATVFDLAGSSAIETSSEAIVLLHPGPKGSKIITAEIAKSKSTPKGGETVYQYGNNGWLEEMQGAVQQTSEEDLFQ